MTRSSSRVMGLAALLALTLSTAPEALAHANLAHERVQLNTNQLVYEDGDIFEFSMDAFPINETNAYTWFIYIQRNETGGRRYYPAFGADTVTDIVGATELMGSFTVPWINNFPMLGPGAWAEVGAPAGLTVGTAPGLTEPGMYSLVAELRDPNGYMVLYTTRTQFVVVNGIVDVTGSITTNTTFTNDNAYLLKGAVFVEDGATLTIERGTVILGENITTGTLIVAQGGKIEAVGTAASPIIMTSDQPQAAKARGQWGGLIINGRAPINIVGGIGIGEGDTGNYGGGLSPNVTDDSGRLSYVRVEYAGKEFSTENELNGIAFQGVGSATEVDHIQVHFNQDDGIEMFGGTVNLKYILLTSIRDDSLDWTEGWTGMAQFVVAQQVGDEADRGIEADNNADNNDLLPVSNPTIYNFTLIGDPDTVEGVESTQGMKLREGTGGRFRNFIVTGFKSFGVDVDTVNAGLSLDKGIVFGNLGGTADAAAAPFVTTLSTENPLIIDPFDTKYPDYRSVLFSHAYNGQNVEIPPDNGFYDTDIWYLGGVDPFNDWTLGWTNTSVID